MAGVSKAYAPRRYREEALEAVSRIDHLRTEGPPGSAAVGDRHGRAAFAEQADANSD